MKGKGSTRRLIHHLKAFLTYHCPKLCKVATPVPMSIGYVPRKQQTRKRTPSSNKTYGMTLLIHKLTNSGTLNGIDKVHLVPDIELQYGLIFWRQSGIGFALEVGKEQHPIPGSRCR